LVLLVFSLALNNSQVQFQVGPSPMISKPSLFDNSKSENVFQAFFFFLYSRLENEDSLESQQRVRGSVAVWSVVGV
jgi:hypothetical protein